MSGTSWRFSRIVLIALPLMGATAYAMHLYHVGAVADLRRDMAAESRRRQKEAVEDLRRQSCPPLPLAQAIDAYHEAFYNSYASANLFWLGVPVTQNPNDVWITQELISRLAPDFIVETGTDRGGSSVIWAMIQDQVNPNGRVITVDIKDLRDEKTLPSIARRKVDFILGSSTSPEVVAEITRRVSGKRVMVVLDSDHRKSHVLAELRAYGPLVTIGSYLIVQDTNLNGHPVQRTWGEGPMEAVDAFLESNTHYRIDRTQERLLFTEHPRGYLKRVD